MEVTVPLAAREATRRGLKELGNRPEKGEGDLVGEGRQGCPIGVGDTAGAREGSHWGGRSALLRG